MGQVLVIRMTDLEPEDFWLDKGERFAIDFDEAFAFLRMVSISFVFQSVQKMVVPCNVRLPLLRSISDKVLGEKRVTHQSSSCRSTARSAVRT